MELIEPSSAFIESYQLALVEFDQRGITGFWKIFGPVDDEAEYVKRITHYQHRTGLENGTVPASVYWLVEGDDFVGHVSVRHSLDASLKQRGGHIGYSIRPSKHRQGYGFHILRLVLPHAKEIGIRSALVTCDADNIASRRIIEKNGGRLTDEVIVNGKRVLQFWIETR